MVGKIRYITALIIVMGMIYVQHSSVIYAGESDMHGDRTAAEEEAYPEEGEENPPKEGDGTRPEEGEDNPPTKEENKVPEEGEDNPPAKTEDKTPAEEKKIIEEYKIEIPEANGKQGYYIKKPEITLCHMSEAGVTKYCLKHGDKKLEEKTLKEKGEKAVITENIFSEGKNILYVWMEDEEGKKLEKYQLIKEILIDTKAPEIQMSVPKGFDTWYQGQVTLSVSGEDSGSGTVKLSCQEGNQSIGSINKEQGEFVISQSSVFGRGVNITVTAEDKAGNKSERIKTVFIDKAAPKITITGAKNYMITGKTVKLACEIDEENTLEEFHAQTVWENAEGKKTQLPSAEWESTGTSKKFAQTLENDGIYHVKVQAKDMSGHITTKETQIIIDKTNPVIRYVETLHGQQLKKFKWEYPAHKMIQDFTTYVYEIRLDGRLYHMGETVSLEGKHRMTVSATDAAGNKAQAAADFVVDNTVPEIVFHNIEAGQEYEEEITFGVELTRKEDAIQQIQINGEDQTIDSGKKVYEYILRACKDYEITVKAVDKAGNEAVKSIFFRIVPKKSLIEKIVEPVKTRWNMGKEADTKSQEATGQGEWKDGSLPVLVKAAGFAVIAGILAAVGVLYDKKANKKRTINIKPETTE